AVPDRSRQPCVPARLLRLSELRARGEQEPHALVALEVPAELRRQAAGSEERSVRRRRHDGRRGGGNEEAGGGGGRGRAAQVLPDDAPVDGPRAGAELQDLSPGRIRRRGGGGGQPGLARALLRTERRRRGPFEAGLLERT